jgi:hypothetical protein
MKDAWLPQSVLTAVSLGNDDKPRTAYTTSSPVTDCTFVLVKQVN